MKITIKTLAKQQFEIEVEESDTVSAVKAKIEEAKKNTDSEMPADAQKLIALGKIMDNDKTLAEYNIKEGAFLVVMVTKPKKPKKPKEDTKAPEPAPAAQPAPATSEPATTAPTTAPATGANPAPAQPPA